MVGGIRGMMKAFRACLLAMGLHGCVGIGLSDREIREAAIIGWYGLTCVGHHCCDAAGHCIRTSIDYGPYDPVEEELREQTRLLRRIERSTRDYQSELDDLRRDYENWRHERGD